MIINRLFGCNLCLFCSVGLACISNHHKYFIFSMALDFLHGCTIYYLLTSDCIRMGCTTYTTRSAHSSDLLTIVVDVWAITFTIEWLNCSEISGSTLISSRVFYLDVRLRPESWCHGISTSQSSSFCRRFYNFATSSMPFGTHVPQYKNPWTWHVVYYIIINWTNWHEHKVLPESCPARRTYLNTTLKSCIYQIKIIIVTTFMHL